MADNPTLKALRAEGAALHADLNEYEIRWRDRQEFLASQGYMLRPRYRPGWVPSWQTDSSRYPAEFEDYWEIPVSTILTLVRNLKSHSCGSLVNISLTQLVYLMAD